MLNIKNVYNIVGHQLQSKWLPQTTGWAVMDVKTNYDTYIFELIKRNNNGGIWVELKVELKREVHIDTFSGEKVYELRGWNEIHNRVESLTRRVQDMRTPKDMALWLGMMVEKMLSKN